MSAFAYIAIYESIGTLFIALSIKWISFDKLVTYGFLLMLLQISIRFIYNAYCRRHFEEARGAWVFDKGQFREMGSFALWITNGTFAVVAYSHGLNLLLNAFFGPVVNAAHAVAFQVQHKIYGFCT